VHSLLRDIAYMIHHVNSNPEQADHGSGSLTLDGTSRYEEGRTVEQYPTRHVKTKCICLSWDLRSNAMSLDLPIILNGRRHRVKPQLDHLSPVETITSSGGQLDAHVSNGSSQENGSNMRFSALERPVFYHLHDSQRLVGEMCLQSSSRWPDSDRWCYNRLLNGQETVAEYISCAGLGLPPLEGLQGTKEMDYDRCETDIQQVLWAT
jgi:hypothetical protein